MINMKKIAYLLIFMFVVSLALPGCREKKNTDEKIEVHVDDNDGELEEAAEEVEEEINEAAEEIQEEMEGTDDQG